MKTAVFAFFFLFFFCDFAFAQPDPEPEPAPGPDPPGVICLYDGAGNRIQRRVILVNERLADTTATEQTAQEPPVIEEGSIAAYPNPTVGAVNLYVSPDLLENTTATYLLVDLSGREIRKGTITQSLSVLDITGEASGNYILTVFVGERKEEWQIVKAP